MQIIFHTNYLIKDFCDKEEQHIFPTAPDKCPFPDCHMPIKLKKHGYYSRFYISKSFNGRIYIRRYICPVCKRTVSMLPMFCIPRFQYCGLYILNTLNDFYHGEWSLNKFVKIIKNDLPSIERRHLNYYRKRIINNRQLIQYGLNMISPEFNSSGTIPENHAWVKCFLEKVVRVHPHVFLVDFSKTTGKTFLTSQNMIA